MNESIRGQNGCQVTVLLLVASIVIPALVILIAAINEFVLK